ncbi:MAG: OmpA family protein [Desulfobacterium sp.]|nr:OmpA family protein [Desulfobacterium sp.]MBU3949444.1 OmpA family protein [Pseudomonadota bacterium]MBU4010043.1 OmpA family protein [Pseudomonadota bacterium]MBU4035935.1 OmpA family protein [Pseudomonadota bacterium]
MYYRLRLAFLFITILLVSGCAAHKDIIVLIPDSDGKTGSITVSNQAGSVAIDSPNHATSIIDSNKLPSPPVKLEQDTIDTMFSEALSMQPKQPQHFILYFEKDTLLTSDSNELIPAIITAIRERNSTDIMVVGHCDTLGSKDYNMTLSENRAISVKDLLIGQGVGPDNIKTTSHGKENPLIKTGDNVSEARNRRVEVVIR